MEGPQLENGYLRIANELYEQIMLAEFSKRELLVILAIIRETYGYGRKEHRISGAQVGRMTGIPREHAARTIATLTRRKVVLNKPHTGYNVLSLNKNYRQWMPSEGSAKTAHVPKQPQASAKTATKLVPKQHTTKDSKDRSKDSDAKQRRGTRWSDADIVPGDWIEWAQVHGLTREAALSESERFCDYWIAIPGTKGVKLNWQATWRNWIRNSHTGKINGHTNGKGTNGSARLSAPERVAARQREILAEFDRQSLGEDDGDLRPQVD